MESAGAAIALTTNMLVHHLKQSHYPCRRTALIKAAGPGDEALAVFASTVGAVTIVNPGEITKHQRGQYRASGDPVVKRREYTRLAYNAFV